MDDDVLIITTNAILDQWCTALNDQDSVAVDTEGDSLHCYFEKLCLIQMTLGPQNVLIDPLEPLDFSKFNTESFSTGAITICACCGAA
jgi:ribonuclease D